MNSLTSGLKKTGKGLGDGVSGIGRSVHDLGSSVGGLAGDQGHEGHEQGHEKGHEGHEKGHEQSRDHSEHRQQSSGLLGSLSKGLGDGVTGIGKGVQDLGGSVTHGLVGGEQHSEHRPQAHSEHSSGLIGSVGSLSKGLGDGVTGITKGVQDLGTSVTHGLVGGEQSHSEHHSEHHQQSPGLLGSLSSGATSVLTPTADLLKSGATLVQDATGAGFSIAQQVTRAGLDTGADVASGTVSVAGTALGGVVAAAANTSGAVFEPVASGLKAIEGLDKLGQGLDAVNGLSLGAVRKVSELTTKALNMSGKTPTFFDSDADGVVCVPDTVRGLVLLGLDEKNAKYAAYALHTAFSYSTSDRWVPALDTTLPIHVAKMSNTRWGRNWGSFERLDWVDDLEIDKFFVPQKDEKQWSDYWKQGRQGFGILLLIFEWGTTWPFYMPPIPVHQIPFASDIGAVVRKAILPTILSNFKRARAADPDAKNKAPSKMPNEDPPTGGKHG